MKDEEWIRDKLNELYHTGTTCDHHGDLVRMRMNAQQDILQEVLEDEWKHHPDDCRECEEMEEIMEEFGYRD